MTGTLDSPMHRLRRERLRQLIDEAGGPKALARLADTVDTYLTAIEKGRRGLGSALAARIEIAMDRPPGWLSGLATEDVNAASLGYGQALQAQPMSHPAPILLPPVTWEEAKMEGYQLPPVFTLAIRDDAMGSKLRAGTEVVWSTQKAAKVGAPVLLRDRAGGLHVRLMAEGDRPGHFRAEPRVQGYRTLDSEEHGLTVLAVYHGRLGDFDEF